MKLIVILTVALSMSMHMGGDTLTIRSGKIENLPAEAAFINLCAVDDSLLYKVAAADIDNLAFVMELKDAPNAKYLHSVATLWAGDTDVKIKVSDPDTSIMLSAPAFVVQDKDNKLLGYVICGGLNYNVLRHQALQWYYADRDCTVVGSAMHNGARMKFNLHLRSGWNVVMESKGRSGTTHVSTEFTDKDAKECQWLFTDGTKTLAR
jgi:hypothetical protein